MVEKNRILVRKVSEKETINIKDFFKKEILVKTEKDEKTEINE